MRVVSVPIMALPGVRSDAAMPPFCVSVPDHDRHYAVRLLKNRVIFYYGL